jgi:hypothetical protein
MGRIQAAQEHDEREALRRRVRGQLATAGLSDASVLPGQRALPALLTKLLVDKGVSPAELLPLGAETSLPLPPTQGRWALPLYPPTHLSPGMLRCRRAHPRTWRGRTSARWLSFTPTATW